MKEYNLRIWETDKGSWKVSKTIVTPDGRELTSNTTKEAGKAFEVAQGFLDFARADAGPVKAKVDLGSKSV